MSSSRKRKDYLKLFIRYAKKYDLWFSVLGDGDIDQITICDLGVDLNPDIFGCKLGSKKAYDWLVNEHKKVLSENV